MRRKKDKNTPSLFELGGGSDTKMIIPSPVVRSKMMYNGGVREGKLLGFTKNSVQIADVFILFAQQRLMGLINEEEISKKAKEEVSILVERYGLDKGKTKEEIKKNRKIVDTLLHTKAREIVTNSIRNYSTLTVDFNKLVESLSIPSLKRKDGSIYLTRLGKLLNGAESDAKLKCTFDVYKEVDGKLVKETEFVTYNLVPTIRVIIRHDDEDEDVMFDTFEEFLAMRKRYKKEKMINRVEFSFNPEALAVFAIPRAIPGYSITDRKYRTGFGKYAFQLDYIVRTVGSSLKNQKRYTPEELMDQFGVSYNRYADFKSKVLVPAIKEINQKKSIHITLKEEKEGRKVKKVFFETRIATDENNEAKELFFSLPFFIAVKHYYSDRYIPNNVIRNSFDFDDYLEMLEDSIESLKSFDKKLTNEESDLTIGEWKKLYEKEIEAWEELIALVKTDKKAQKIIEEEEWVISKKRIGLVDKEGNYGNFFKDIPGNNIELPSEQLKMIKIVVDKGV